MADYDVVIIGGGAAGLTLAHRMSEVNQRRGRPLRTALVEPPTGPHTPPPRTWCFWEREGGVWDPLLTARWRDLSVVTADGAEHRSPAAPYLYKMLRSDDVAAHVRGHADAYLDQRELYVRDLTDGPERATVHAVGPAGADVRLTARWVFDSRPPTDLTGGRTTLLQHFRGWFVRVPRATFDPRAAVLMDLRPPQPTTGVAFGYVLPSSPREALVEYTEFGRAALRTEEYDEALTAYCAQVGLGEVEVTAAEQGVIPMTDATFPTRVGRRLFRIGTAGGATRPSTGYTFSGVARQTAAVARALAEDRTPIPPVPYRARHLAMDAVMLRALDTGRVRGSDFFARLFAANRLGDVLAFLDGTSPLPRELAMGLTTPVAAMSWTVLDHLWYTLRDRGLSRRGRPSPR
ncbi:lycopene cyclase family protein [Nocardiopsis sp. MG754419]|uniref:lycopene cyclase family protein n=1 Tax=Nocardiopsis sp. MG754419 TaxID=2259865 RepID=UPI001BA4E8E3|nr:lycopene cyclase family protein [Nocardiopsis sp. MG754419]MBR8744627.1 lycopene cyclase [Nocardiopsis sp. MG754419]